MSVDLGVFRKQLDQGLVDPRVFLDPDLYELELERVWRRSWIFVAHDSMIAKPGDYITTFVGEDPVIVTRDAKGKVRVLLNRCRHKGVKLCPFERGSAKAFSCVYHGWTFANDGTLINVPEAAAYGDLLDKSQWGLIELPKVQSYGGFIFANWDAGAISLDDFLGDMRYYFDNGFGRLSAGEVEISAIKQRSRTHHNWKVSAENASDMYHLGVSHAGIFDTIEGMAANINWELADGNFNAVIHEQQVERPVHTIIGGRLVKEPEVVDLEIARRFGSDSVDYVRQRYAQMRKGDMRVNGAFYAAGVFPSLLLIDVGLLSVGISIELYHPKGPRETETWVYIVVEKDAPPAFKKYAAQQVMRSHSISGSIIPSDHENWERMDEGLGSPASRDVALNYTFGLSDAAGPPGFQSGGYDALPGVGKYAMTERGARAFYRHWLQMMQEA